MPDFIKSKTTSSSFSPAAMQSESLFFEPNQSNIIFVDKINGCYDNVVGFPLSRFVFELKKIGINLNEIS